MTIAPVAAWKRGLAIIAISAASVALTGCSLIPFFGGGNVTRDDSGGIVQGNEDTDVFTLQVGDCLNDSSASDTVDTLPTVPCSQPHDSEIFASFLIDDGPFPGLETVIDIADAGCAELFPSFVGIPYAESIYYYSFYFPTEGSWSNGDREVLCTIYDDRGQTTGSLRNVGR